jgi:hypothetical protein
MVVPEKTEGLFGMFYLLLFVAVSHLPRLLPVQDLVPVHLEMRNKRYCINEENILEGGIYINQLLFNKITH